MNNKVIAGVVVAVILLIGAFVVQRTTSPVSPTTTTPATIMATTSPTSSIASTSKPIFNIGTTTTKTVARDSVHFDASSLFTTSSYPTITGTASASKVSIIISTIAGTGLVGTSDIPVVRGHWSYSCPVLLPAGTYAITLFGGDVNAIGVLQVRNP